MKILFLHGWNSVPGGVKPTYLAKHGHEVINPKLPDEDFDEAVRIAQAEFDKHKPDVVVLQDIYHVEEAGFQPYARKFHEMIKETGAKTVLFGTASVLGDYTKGFERLHRLHLAMGKELGVPVWRGRLNELLSR